MCVRVSRGLLRLRSDASTPAAAGLVRSLCVEAGKGTASGATEGLAQAILQERLQQQQVSQVGQAAPSARASPPVTDIRPLVRVPQTLLT